MVPIIIGGTGAPPHPTGWPTCCTGACRLRCWTPESWAPGLRGWGRARVPEGVVGGRCRSPLGERRDRLPANRLTAAGVAAPSGAARSYERLAVGGSSLGCRTMSAGCVLSDAGDAPRREHRRCRQGQQRSDGRPAGEAHSGRSPRQGSPTLRTLPSWMMSRCVSAIRRWPSPDRPGDRSLRFRRLRPCSRSSRSSRTRTVSLPGPIPRDVAVG